MVSAREYFAGQALNAMLRSSYDCNCSGYEFKNIVAGAREYADDLVNELRKTSEQGESPTISTNKPNATCLRCGHMEVCYYYKHSGGGCCGKFVPRTSHVA
jgi:hypothetical protein